VHIVHAGLVGTMGSTVGQAHLLDDLISLVRFFAARRCTALTAAQLELGPEDGPSILERMTFTYGLGEEHGLYNALRGAAEAEER
jgi:m7GpppX diphosphatase